MNVIAPVQAWPKAKERKRKHHSVAPPPKVIQVATFGIRNLEKLLDRKQKPATSNACTQTDRFPEFDHSLFKEHFSKSFKKADEMVA